MIQPNRFRRRFNKSAIEHSELRLATKRKRRLAVETLERRYLLATLVVNSVDDTVAMDGKVTLREAIIAANNDSSTETGVAGNGFDIIRFDPDVFPTGKSTTIKLTGGPLNITSDLFIYGPGISMVDDPLMPGVKINAQQLVIDADNRSSVFTTSGVNVQIGGVQISGGNDSGVVNSGGLVLDRVTVSGNTGTSGGGVRNTGQLTIDSSQIFSNSATTGGGVFSSTIVSIFDSAIFRNTASGNGGGIAADAVLVGVDGGTISVINSTISNNVATGAGGGLWSSNNRTTVSSATITGNRSVGGGGGIGVRHGAFSGTLTLQNTIVGGNARGAGGMNDLADDISEFTTGQVDQTAARNNLIGDPATSAGIQNGTNGNIVGDGSQPLDIDLVLDRRLQSFGGTTMGHALLTESPAIDAGDNSLLPLGRFGTTIEADQRGLPFLRSIDSPTLETNGRSAFIEFNNPVVDIGAIESEIAPVVGSPLSLVVSTIVDESDGDFSDGDLSLREAIEIANRNPDRNVISFAPGLPVNTRSDAVGFVDPRVLIRLDETLGELPIVWDLAITGPGSTTLAINGGFGTRILNIGPNARVDLSGFGIDDGQVGNRGVAEPNVFGAGIFNQGIANLYDVTLNRNRVVEGDGVTLSGGAAIVNTGTMSLENVSLTNNLALANANPMFGGAIYNSGRLQIGPSVVMAGNTATFGGGLANVLGTVTMSDTVIERNSAVQGGGVYTQDGSVTITDSRFLNNAAVSAGGGIYHLQGNLSVSRTTLDANRVASTDAAVNEAGGGVFSDTTFDGNLLLSKSTISNNEAQLGGGVFLVPFGFGVKLLTGLTISNNRALGTNAIGGGVFIASTATGTGPQIGRGAIINRSTIVFNSAEGDAVDNTNGLAIVGSVEKLENTIIADNARIVTPGVPGAESNLQLFPGSILQTAQFNFLSSNAAFDTRFIPNLTDPTKPNPSNNIIFDQDVVDPPLSDNGGPTLTHKLINNSLAIDNGKELFFEDPLFIHNAFDQRGLPVTEIIGRPPGGPPELGTSTDIGAYEVQQLAVIPWESFVDSVSQFAPGTATVEYGVGFDNGQPNSSIKAEPEFLGVDLDPRPVSFGGIGSVLGAKFGAEARLDAKIRIGLEYGYYVNAGSVDVRYEGDFSYAIGQSATSPGTFNIDTGVHIEDGLLYSISPRFGFYIDLVIQFDFEVSGSICAVKCASGDVPIPDVDERITLLAINRPKQDAADVDGDGDTFEQLLFDETLNMESPRDDARFPNLVPQDRILKAQLTGDIQFLASPMELLLERLPPEVATGRAIGDYLHGEITARAEAKAEEMIAEQDREKGKPGADEKAEAAKRKVEQADKNVASGTKKKPGAMAAAGGGVGFVLNFSETAGDSLLGVQVDAAIGAQFGEIGVTKPLGSFKLTLPDVQLADGEIDRTSGMLSASTDDFVPGSTQDQNRQLAELSLDVAGILGPLIGFPGGRFEASFGPVTAKVTTVAYDLVTTLSVTQDINVMPFFNDPDSLDPAMRGDHVSSFRFDGPVTASVNGGLPTTLNPTESIDHDNNPATPNVTVTPPLMFMPGDSLAITPITAGGVNVYPSLKVGNRFHNDIGLDIDVKGILEILKLTFEAFGADFDLGPLFRNEHSIGSFDLGSIFDRTFDLATPNVPLPTFGLGTPMDGMGSGLTPGNAITLVPGMMRQQPNRLAEAVFYGVPLRDANGTSATTVEFSTPGGANLEFIALQPGQTLQALNPTDGSVTRTLELTPGVPRGFSADRWRITGFDEPIDGRGLFAMIYNTPPGTITARPQGMQLNAVDAAPTSRINRAAANMANGIFIESDNVFDIDGDGLILVQTDGALLTRYMDGMTGDQLIANVIAPGSMRTDAAAITAYLDSLTAVPMEGDVVINNQMTLVNRLDFDGDGQMDSATDGRILLRQLAGIGGESTTSGLGLSGFRTAPTELFEFINGTQINDDFQFFINPIEINDRTGGDPFGTAAEFAVSPTAVVGSSAWLPIRSTAASQFIDTVTLTTFGDSVPFEDTFITNALDPNLPPLLVSSAAVGTPAVTTGVDIGEIPTTMAEMEAFARRQAVSTRNALLGTQEPIFIGLPDAAHYEFTLSDGFQFAGLGFDASAADNRLFDHSFVDDGTETDFDLYVPATDQWFEISTNNPRFTIPGGATRFVLYPRQLPNAGTDASKLLLSLGLILSGTGDDPVVTVTHNYARRETERPPVQFNPAEGLTSGEFYLVRNQAHVDFLVKGVRQQDSALFTHPLASLAEIPMMGTPDVPDTLVIDSRMGPISSPITFLGGSNVAHRDVVRLVGAGGTINLATDKLGSVEVVDIQGSGSNTLILDSVAIIANESDEGVLLVLADSDDTIDLSQWTRGGSIAVDGFAFMFDIYEKDGATVFIGDDPVAGTPPAPTSFAARPNDFVPVTPQPPPLVSDAVQIITPVLERGQNGSVRIALNYSVENPLPFEPNNLQLQIHYDSERVRFDGAENDVTDGLEVCQEREETLPDSDPSTDRMIVCLWYDDENGWPSSTNLPAEPLLRLNFTSLDAQADNVIRIQGAGANGYEFQAPISVSIANTVPTISDIPNQMVAAGASTPSIAFSVGDEETAPATLTVAATSTNLSLVPLGNIVFGGTGGGRTITVTPVNGRTGSSIITVTVTDEGGLVASDSFELTVGSATSDSIVLGGANETVMMSAIDDATLSAVSTIDIRGTGDNALILDAAKISTLTPNQTLVVFSDAGDRITFGDGWIYAGSEVVDGGRQRIFQLGEATVRVVGPLDWTNPYIAGDVNGSGAVTASDALDIIFALNQPELFTTDGRLVPAAGVDDASFRFLDPNQDLRTTAGDALLIINILFMQDLMRNSEGENATMMIPGDLLRLPTLPTTNAFARTEESIPRFDTERVNVASATAIVEGHRAWRVPIGDSVSESSSEQDHDAALSGVFDWIDLTM